MTELRPLTAHRLDATVRFAGTNVTAVLGPTNTGKTFLAIERMVAHSSGTIGLPLRLLAREVYQKVCDRVGVGAVSLITGEEKIKPPKARYQVCTVEAMPRDPATAFVAIDEVQLASDLERGHVFTDRILHARGREETLLLGASTMHGVLTRLLSGAQTVTRPRLSNLTYAGSKKITRLPRRSAIVAFSAGEVYAIAELIRRQRGGAAVVLGALSPRTRNAQVELYQSGDVDFLVATDAIGMGLNLDVDHVAFAQDWKYDGFQYRQLTPAEYGQIAGRAGRHLRDGTFGVTGQVDPLAPELYEALEAHTFQPVRVIQWRNRDFDFSSVETLKESLEVLPPVRELTKSLPSVDQRALEFLSRDPAVQGLATGSRRVELLWEACKLPDYRRIAPAQHAEIIASIFGDLARHGHVAEDYMASQVRRADRIDGDIDSLSQRIAEIRTWTYISHRPDWLADPTHWQEKTRDIEDRLSDALHERLTKRFVDRRTSVLMRRLRENAYMEAEIGGDGTVTVEGHAVGELQGFRFTPDAKAEGPDGKAVRAAATKALASEYDRRAERFANAPNGDLALGADGYIRWLGSPVAMLAAGESPLTPKLVLLADDQLAGASRDKVVARAMRSVTYQVTTILKPLLDLQAAENLEGAARGLAYRLVENYGLVQRRDVADEVRSLDQDARAALRRCGVRFGAYHIFVPTLIKPAPASLLTLLWAIHNDGRDKPGYGEITHLLATGRTSAVADQDFDRVFWGLSGYRLLGRRAVRIDILERLADLIRPALSWKPGSGKRPEGGYNGAQFMVTPQMMSILGATADDMEEILKGLGYRAEAIEEPKVKAQLDRLDAEAMAAEAAAAEAAERKAADEAAAGSKLVSSEGPDGVETPGGSVEPREDSDNADEAAVAATGEAETAPAQDHAGDENVLSASIPEGDETTTAVRTGLGEAAADGASALNADTTDADRAAMAGPSSAVEALADDAAPIAAPADRPAADDTAAAAKAETVGAKAAAPSTGEDEAPKIIQIWRQPRAGGRPGGRQHQRGRGDGAPRARQDAGTYGTGQGEHAATNPAPGGERQGRGPRDRVGKGRGKGGAERGEGGNRRFDKRGGDKPHGSEGRPGRGAAQQGRPPHETTRPPQNNRPQRVDPDSPFAKLAALKDKLGR